MSHITCLKFSVRVQGISEWLSGCVVQVIESVGLELFLENVMPNARLAEGSLNHRLHPQQICCTA
jgi:hypothetical protein